MAWFRLIRYKNLIIIALLQYLLRYALILPILQKYGVEPVLSDLRFALLVLSTICLAASGYAINDYFDIHTDNINRPQRVVVGHQIKRREALMTHMILTFAGVLIGFFLAYVTRKESYVLIYLVIPFLLWHYSTTLKKQILTGNLVISLLTAMVPYVVVSLEFGALGRRQPEIIESEACATAWFWTTGFAFFAFISNLSREMIKDLEDIKGDQANGCRTLPIALGTRYTKILIILLTLFSILALWAAYLFIPELSESNMTFFYFIVALTLPYIALMWLIRKARIPSDYHKASQVSKLIMLTGILYILIAGMLF